MQNNNVKVIDIYNYIDSIAPFSTAMDFDNVGLLVGDPNKTVNKILVTLDITDGAVDKAKKYGAELIVSHHPVIFNPIKNVLSDSVVYSLCNKGISAICAHTNLDAASGGVNDILCEIIGLKNVEIWPPENIGRIGYTDYDLHSFADIIVKNLDTSSVNLVDCGKRVKKVAVMSGSGGGDIDYAVAVGADTLLTGEMKHSQYISAKNKGINVIAAGHFDTEYIVVSPLSKKIATQFPSVDVSVYKEPSYKVIINNLKQ
ncbi:MAG: Nif3-like dinuclear metal center hexameric protein [Clostridia bacterium]|nr:Nif3-like dinuclear metal center hexameric protein [Clostridia bacterium]